MEKNFKVQEIINKLMKLSCDCGSHCKFEIVDVKYDGCGWDYYFTVTVKETQFSLCGDRIYFHENGFSVDDDYNYQGRWNDYNRCEGTLN